MEFVCLLLKLETIAKVPQTVLFVSVVQCSLYIVKAYWSLLLLSEIFLQSNKGKNSICVPDFSINLKYDRNRDKCIEFLRLYFLIQ